MKKPLRRVFRIILKYLSILVLKKHQPDVIVVTGNGKTAITREAIYTVLHEHFPTRRNLEAPEAEFSVPLTIFGVKHYPFKYRDWLKILTKTALQLLRLKPHFHILILELNPNLGEIADYWFEITKPKIVVQCGQISFQHPHLEKAQKFICPESKNGYLTPHFEIAKKIGKNYDLADAEVETSLQKFNLPKARIRLIRGKHGKIIVDSSYHYFPPPIKSVLEILDTLPGKKVVFTTDPEEKRQILTSRQDYRVATSIADPKIESSQIIAVRGQKNQVQNLLKDLAATEFLI